MNSPSQELLPCPFCGDEHFTSVDMTSFDEEPPRKWQRIKCNTCGAMAPDTAWNTRAQAAYVPVQVEHLHELAIKSGFSPSWAGEKGMFIVNSPADLEKFAQLLLQREGGEAADMVRNGWEYLVAEAIQEANYAMVKWPAPNKTLLKLAEESGEVIQAAVHLSEGRCSTGKLRREMVQSIAMHYRLWAEGDAVNGVPVIANPAPQIPAQVQVQQASALVRYNQLMQPGEEPCPIERLRFFLSNALNAQDWLDVEPFIDAVKAQQPTAPGGEVVYQVRHQLKWVDVGESRYEMEPESSRRKLYKEPK